MANVNSTNVNSTNIKHPPQLFSTHFEAMKEKRVHIMAVFKRIDERVKKLNVLHTSMVSDHIDDTYRFGLDTFNFQTKLIYNENVHMKNTFNFIENRIYCEYYKLYHIIHYYVLAINDNTIITNLSGALNKKFQVYKDLEPFKPYDFTISQDIGITINEIIEELFKLLKSKTATLNDEITQANMGINIHGLVYERTYKVKIMEEKLNTFKNYLQSFEVQHNKYIDDFIERLNVSDDIIHRNNTSTRNIFQTTDETRELEIDLSKVLPNTFMDVNANGDAAITNISFANKSNASIIDCDEAVMRLS